MDLGLLADNTVWKVLAAVADILVVSYLIYRVLLLIRGTRAQQVLVGLALVGIAFFASKFLQLHTLSWIFDNFIGSFLLLVIVVFQHDIRRGLSRVGRRPFFGGVAYGQGAYLVDELTRAAEAMSRDKIGAIILLEREADLSELAETGIRIDGRVSTGLIVQTFMPPGPLHDGAAIIQQGRLTAGAVFLPLTQNPRLDPSLGTRHRAAVGATEEVDAVAIVVSEERGQISIAEGGALTRDLDPAMLRKVLTRYFGPRTVRVAKERRTDDKRRDSGRQTGV
ncbi:MAG: TIGR00159 family protein [Deltaproteobacteria bacterium]|nr:TIGR00159 family protein [Deltaproteobacteria bacterium]